MKGGKKRKKSAHMHLAIVRCSPRGNLSSGKARVVHNDAFAGCSTGIVVVVVRTIASTQGVGGWWA